MIADECRTSLAKQHTTATQHWHATVQSIVTKDKLYTISDNTPLQKTVRNSREGS